MNIQLNGLSEAEIRSNLTAALITAYRLLLQGCTPTPIIVQFELALMQAGVDLREASKGIEIQPKPLAAKRDYPAGRGGAQ